MENGSDTRSKRISLSVIIDIKTINFCGEKVRRHGWNMYGIPLIVPRGSQPPWFGDEGRGRDGSNTTVSASTALDEAEREYEAKVRVLF